MAEASFFEQVTRAGVIPVIAIEKSDWTLPLADAVLEGGLRVIEITFRTAAAVDVIRTVVAERPQLIVGAGTVLTIGNVEAAKSCGASFGVAPGLNPGIIKAAQQVGLPFIPGIATPTDIESGLDLGCNLFKFFPAEALGGVAMLEALAAPYRHRGVRFLPTGGVNANNLEGYLKIETVAAVGGTWIAKPDDLAKGNWDEIRLRCKNAAEIVRQVRSRQQGQ